MRRNGECKGRAGVGRDSDSMENVMFFLGLFVEFCEGVSILPLLLQKRVQTMETSATAPAMSSGRLLKSEPRKGRSISEDRIKFIEEEYDVILLQALHVVVSFS